MFLLLTRYHYWSDNIIYIYIHIIGHMMVIFDGMVDEIFDGRYVTNYIEVATMMRLII